MRIKKTLIGIIAFVFAIALATTNGTVILNEKNADLEISGIVKTDVASAEGSEHWCYSSYYTWSGYKVTYCGTCSLKDGYGTGGQSKCN